MPQSFGELRINQDINMLNLRDNLGWKPIEVSTFMGILGASVTTGGKTVKPSLKRECSSPRCVFQTRIEVRRCCTVLGMRGHTTMSNLVMAVAFFLQGGRSKYFSQYSCLCLWFIGGRKRDAVEATCTKLTLEQTDMGKGQVAAALSNFKSLAAIFGPMIAAKIYT